MKKLLVALLGLPLVLASCGQPPAATSPSPSAPASPNATASPRPSIVTSIDHEVVFVARDRLPPVAMHLKGAGGGNTPEARISSRLDALMLVPPVFEGQFNVLRQTKARLAAVTVNGDLATIDYTVANDDWGIGGSASLRAFVQQVVYTASEEPGIGRVLITQNGGKQAIIGGEGLVISGPTTREQQNAYTPKASREPFISGEAASFVTDLSPRVSVDTVAPALARVVIDVRRRDTPTDGRFMPQVNVEVMDASAWKGPELGKAILKVSVAKGADSVAGMRLVDKSPLRAIWTESALGGEGGGTTYYVGLDDLRPWRVGLLFDPVRIVLDIGGDPDTISADNAIYAPAWNATVDHSFTISGLARAFEANVAWRVKDSNGKLLANGHTLASIGTSAFFGGFQTGIALPGSAKGTVSVEVYEVSMKDGSELSVATVPVLLK